MARVREVMTQNPEKIEANASVSDAATVMHELEIGAVPVVVGGAMQGMITDRDIAIRVVAENRNPSEVKVSEIATPNPVTVGPDAEMSEAEALMAQRQVRRLPVVENGNLVGILALGDVSIEASAKDAGRVLRDVSNPAQPGR